MLPQHLLHIDQNIGGQSWVFQQDKAPIHRAKVNNTGFEMSGIGVMEWTAYLLDLNPMGNLWALVCMGVYLDGRV